MFGFIVRIILFFWLADTTDFETALFVAVLLWLTNDK